jgi:phosphoglycerate dehydrogenase-like enzyme
MSDPAAPSSTRHPISTVLIVHATPDDFRVALEEKYPSIRFHWLTADDRDIAPLLEETRPDAVFSIVTATFRGPAHRQAASYPSVQWVHCGGSGYEHLLPLDLNRVVLTNCVGVLAPFLAETVIAGMLALNSRLVQYHLQQAKRLWEPHSFRPVQGQTLLVLGLGAIGKSVARIAKALGMRVLATARSTDEAHHPDVDELHPHARFRELLPRADVLSVHLRHTADTEGLIDRAVLEALPRHALFINTARGAIVNEPDLIAVLQSGHLAGAYLDVFATEPLSPESPLWSIDRVLISPHASDNTVDWTQRFAKMFADNLDRWMSGAPLVNIVRF